MTIRGRKVDDGKNRTAKILIVKATRNLRRSRAETNETPPS